jgi:hypothetical protein
MSRSEVGEALAPEPIVPVRAVDWPDVRGQRVIVGKAGLGWRTDLRADSCVTQDDRTFVPVLTEHDWYRSEAEQMEVFAPLVPISRVWVEVPRYDHRLDQAAPSVRLPVPVEEASSIVGCRVVCFAPGTASGFERAFRAVAEVGRGSRGRRVILVVKELDWYRWTWTGRIPKAIEVPAEQAWIE